MRKPMQRSFCLAFILIILAISVASQGGRTGNTKAPVWAAGQQYGFDVWTTENGLPQNTVTAIAQSPDGYLWLSTFDGLARFDGVHFTIFDTGNTPGITNNRFSGMFVDADDSVLAFTESGLLTVYRDGVFVTYSPLNGLIEPVLFISGDSSGRAIIETSQNYYYLQDGNFVRTPDEKIKGVRLTYFARSGAKWVLEREQITCYRDGKATVYRSQQSAADLAGASGALFEDSKGGLWLKSQLRSTRRLIDGRVTDPFERLTSQLPGLTDVPVIEDSDGSFFAIFGDYDRGVRPSKLVRLTENGATVQDLGEVIRPAFGIRDREGNLWLAGSGGLRRLRRQLITSLSTRDALTSNEVYPLLQTRDGDVLIGGVSGVDRYANRSISSLGLKYPTQDLALYMRSLWQDDQGRVWLGYQGGFGRLENGSLHQISKETIAEGATDLTQDHAGTLWAATAQGIYVYKNDEQIAHYTDADGLPSNGVITVREDRGGNIWAGTYNGLAMFRDGHFVSCNDEPGSPRGFVRAIYEDADGTLWFGTYGDGLVRYRDGRFFNYRVEDGMFNNGVFAILDDDRGNFWMSSNRGIHRVSKQELNDYADGSIPKLNSVSYNQSDGMLNAECNGGRLPAAIKTQDGKLWFATMGGVAIVDPAAEQVNPNPPPVVIEKVGVDHRPLDEPLLRSALRNAASAIEMQAGQSNLDIDYTALNMVRSEQTKFKYKLEGLDAKWIEAGTSRTVNYSYLPHGSYTFRVIAANANGIWNNEGAAVRVIVYPYFYQTWWFVTLGVLAACLIIWLIYRNRISHLQAIAETRSAFARQLIESQEAERKRIAAELHDGLGQDLVIIKNRATLGLSKGGDPARVAQELGSISESASQALDEVREITNNLRPQLLDRLGLTKAIRAMLKKVAGVMEIDSLIDNIDHVFSENDEINIYRIVQESVNNIIKHSNASDAWVTIERGDTRVLITISDNGKGFIAESISPERLGFGLTGLSERAHLLQGELSIESRPGKGTSIKLSIPIKP